MSKPIIFVRVDRDAPVLMPFVVKREKGLEYHREKLGLEFRDTINQSFEEVINKAADLFILASQSPRSFKMIDTKFNSDPEKFREEMAERYESLDDLQKAYVDLDKMMLDEFWEKKYGTAIVAIPMIAAGAMIFIDQQIDKQLRPKKSVTWRDQVEDSSKKVAQLSGEAKSQERSGDF